MKHILTFFIVLTLTNFVKAQNSNITATQDSFVGTWEWHDNNQIFRLILSRKDNNKGYDGHFMMIHTTNGSETIIYNSNKVMNYGIYWWPVISGGSLDGINFSGSIIDNSVVLNQEFNTYPQGRLKMTIIPETCSNCPPSLIWKVYFQDIVPSGMPDFNIPIDLILTKIN